MWARRLSVYKNSTPKNVQILKFVAKRQRNAFIRRALRGASRPMTIREIVELDVETHGMELFKENISYIFPVILELSANGESVLYIERVLKLGYRRLVNTLAKYPQLKKVLDNAKELHLDPEE